MGTIHRKQGFATMRGLLFNRGGLTGDQIGGFICGFLGSLTHCIE